MQSHPNAIAATISSALSVTILWLLRRYFHIDLSLTAEGILVGAINSLVLFVGRDGIRGFLTRIWRGSKAAWTGAPPAKP